MSRPGARGAGSGVLRADEVFFLVPPRGGAVSGRSFEPIVAILLFSCTLALHARQVDIKLRLDYLWAAQARCAFSAPWRVGCGKEAPREGSQGLLSGHQLVCG